MFFSRRHILSILCTGSLLLAAFPAVPHAAAAGNPGAQSPAQQTRPENTATPDSQDWQSIDSGTRPAYAGIQGGTAPLTVLRSSNGLLFAFTGQTGNDFTQVLRGSSANASATDPAVPQKQAQQPVASAPAADATEVILPPEQEELLSRIALAAHAKHRGNLSARRAETGPQAAENTEEKIAAAAGQSTAPAVSNTDQASAVAPVATGNLPLSASFVEALAMPAPETPVLIFASGDLASEISVSKAVVPFGLPLPGERMGNPPPPTPEVPPLKLGDYRNIIYRKGSL